MAMNAPAAGRALLADLLVFDVAGRRPRARVGFWLAVVIVYAAWRSAVLIGSPLPLTMVGYVNIALDDAHAIASLSEGINEVWCGKPALSSDVYSIGVLLVRQPSDVSTPVRTLIERAAGSVTAYCGTVTEPFANNENSLAMLDAAVLRLGGRSMTPVTVGRALLALRLAILLLFCGAVLLAGGSVLMCVGVFEAGLALCRLTLFWSLSIYPFLFVAPLLSIALYVWLFDRADRSPRPLDWVLLAAVGLAASFGANMRTSHMPAYAMLLALFLWLWRPPAWRHLAAAVVVVCAAYLAANWAIVTRRQSATTVYNRSYHVVAHPLVLSLAVPDNSVARREGIKWRDSAGDALARRADPSATYLGPSYERALFRYYWSLWLEHPREMAALYLWKFDIAGYNLVQYLSQDARPIWTSIFPWMIVGNGLMRLWVMIALLAGSVAVYRRRRSTRAALAAMLTLVAIMLHLEMSIIMPSFNVIYHGFTVFYAALLGIAAAQFAVNGVWIAVRTWSGDLGLDTRSPASYATAGGDADAH
jgi:hypothetical protein